MQSTPNFEVIPVEFKYLSRIYDGMDKASSDEDPSHLVQYGYPASETAQVRVFRGFIKDVAKEAGVLPAAQYKATSQLKAMNAITLIRHGGPGQHLAIYLVNYRPTLEQFNKFKEENVNIVGRTLPRKDELYTRDIAGIRKRLRELEDRVATLERQSSAGE